MAEHFNVVEQFGIDVFNEETMKQTEKQNAGDGRRCGDKKWERGR